MRNFLRTNYKTAFDYNAMTENLAGGVALWDIPATVGCIFNPLIFIRTKYWYHGAGFSPDTHQGYSQIPNFVRFSGTTLMLEHATASAIHVRVRTDVGELSATVYTGRKEYYMSDKCSAIYEVLSVSFSSSVISDYCKDSKYIYIRIGYEYMDDTYVSNIYGQYLYRDSKTIDSVVLNVYRPNGTYTSLSVEPYKGVAKLDVSSVVKIWLKRDLLDFGDSFSVIDNSLSVRYIIKGIGGTAWEKTFLGVNAVAQIGEPSDLSAYHNKVLTKFPHLYQYGGYPLDYAILGGEGPQGIDVRGDEIPLLHVTRYKVSGTVVLLKHGTGENDNVLESHSGEAITVQDDSDIPVFGRCVPKYPFYVRWINRLGGVDYWMFSHTQKDAPAVKSSEVFSQYVEDPAHTNTNSIPFGLSTERLITVGAEQLNKAEFRALSELPYSPLIEVYQEKKNSWVRLSVAKFDGTNNSSDETKSVEVQFNLPTIYTQF